MNAFQSLKQEASDRWDVWMLTCERPHLEAWWITCEAVLVNQNAPPLVWNPKEHKHG